jgi:hypothetical protein
MMALRYLTVLFSLTIIMMMQACGNGSGTTDTAGSLTISAPTATNNNDGSFSVSATVTYDPPAGKSAQGVVVTTTATDNFGNFRTDEATLTSGSNSKIYTYTVRQNVGTSSTLSIKSNIGGMVSSVSIVIPAITPLGAPGVQFKSTDAPGTVLTSALSGGIVPYTLVSVSTSALSVSLIGTTLNVTNSTTGLHTASATIIVTDANGSQLSIPVGYFVP